MKKIKIFLGAYVNFPNAQNVNCDNIAKYLNKDKFEVHTMYINKMPINKKMYKDMDIHLHRLIHHRFIWWWSKYLIMLFGNYDIYYLPKMETVDRFFAEHHHKNFFVSSIEGVVGEQIEETDLNAKQYLTELMDYSFSISNCIKVSASRYWNYNSKVLYLGINQENKNETSKKTIQTVIWIGSLIKRKRPEYFLECAKKFSQLNFILVGDGDLTKEVQSQIFRENITNIECLGRIQNKQVYEILEKADLFLMTSDKEGLPKVIGEAMSQRIPVIYINECYDVDYVESCINGYAVPDLETMQDRIQFLLDNPETYQKMSNAAYESIQPYTWKNVIKQYEEYFEEVYEKKGK